MEERLPFYFSNLTPEHDDFCLLKQLADGIPTVSAMLYMGISLNGGIPQIIHFKWGFPW